MGVYAPGGCSAWALSAVLAGFGNRCNAGVER
jgi:hypothetical protein